MYSMNSTSRRITTFVEEEAYKWLFNKIVKNEYDASGNGHGQKVILDIKKAGRVTRETYEKFTSMVAYNPFTCIIQGTKSRSSKFIVTDKVENFFLKYNGTTLPIGFVRDFFEDDYETQAEVNRYIESIVKGQKERFDIQCQSAMLYKKNQAEELKEARPSVFKTALSFHVTNIIKAILVIVTLIVSLNFIISEEVVQKIVGFFSQGLYGEFFERYWFHVVLNIAVLFFLIFRVIKLIKTIIFYIRLTTIRAGVKNLELSVKQLENGKLQALGEYFMSIIPTLSRTHVISEDMYNSVPAAKSQYFAVMDFDFQKAGQKIANLYSSHQFAFLNAYYESTEKKELAPKKRSWRRGIAFNLILCILLCFMNIEGLRTFAVDTIEPILTSLGFDLSGEEEPEIWEYTPGSDVKNNEADMEFVGENIADASEYTTSQIFRSNSDGDWMADNDEDFPDGNYSLCDEIIFSESGSVKPWTGFHHNSPDYAENGYHSVEFEFAEEETITGVALYFATSEIGTIESEEDHMVDPTTPTMVELLVYNEDDEAWYSVATVSPKNRSTEDCGYAERVAIPGDYENASRIQVRFAGEGWHLLSEVEIFADV